MIWLLHVPPSHAGKNLLHGRRSDPVTRSHLVASHGSTQSPHLTHRILGYECLMMLRATTVQPFALFRAVLAAGSRICPRQRVKRLPAIQASRRHMRHTTLTPRTAGGMRHSVRFPRLQLKVLQPVVHLVPIDVMDDLSWQQVTSEAVRHDQPMLQNVAVRPRLRALWSKDQSVAMTTHGGVTVPAVVVRSAAAMPGEPARIADATADAPRRRAAHVCQFFSAAALALHSAPPCLWWPHTNTFGRTAETGGLTR